MIEMIEINVKEILKGNQEWTIQTQAPAKGKQFLPSNSKNIYNTITSAKTRQ